MFPALGSLSMAQGRKEGHTMLSEKRVTPADTALRSQINQLYQQAFPPNERRDLSHLLTPGQNIGEVFAYCDQEGFVGFACLLNSLDISHIIYFAVTETLRDKGYGSEILRRLCRQKPGNRVIVDIERDGPSAENHVQRQQRKQFYLRNGFGETPVKYRWQQEDYEILSYGGTIQPEEFHQFWQAIDRMDRDMLY